MSSGSGPRRRAGSMRPPPALDPKAFAQGVGEAVRRARQSLGWTQSELAENAGLSANYVARLERGEVGPSLFVAHQVCVALGIELAELLPEATPARRTTGRRAGA